MRRLPLAGALAAASLAVLRAAPLMTQNTHLFFFRGSGPRSTTQPPRPRWVARPENRGGGRRPSGPGFFGGGGGRGPPRVQPPPRAGGGGGAAFGGPPAPRR